MKSLLLTVVGLVGVVRSEAPYPASGSRPQGALLVLPHRQRAYRPQNIIQELELFPSISLERLSDLVSQRLNAEGRFSSTPAERQREYLRAEYRTSQSDSRQTARAGSALGRGYGRQRPAEAEEVEAPTVPAASNTREELASPASQRQAALQQPQQQQPALVQAQPVVQQTGVQWQALTQEEVWPQPQSQAYVAQLQYTQLQPIPPPIYSLTSQPLLRILRQSQ